MSARLKKQQATARLERLIHESQVVEATVSPTELPQESTQFKAWRRDVEVAIRNIFDAQSNHANEFRRISFEPGNYGASDEVHELVFKEGHSDARALLQSMVREIQDYWDDDMVSVPSISAQANEAGRAKPTTRDVFIVHGHDEGFQQAVARVLHQLDLHPIILHEKANEGKTIIEKFDAYGDVSYAVALFTPDDLGESVANATALENLKPRARQNVVFELGYFIGRRGRSNACALVKGKLELPSDYSGVVYIPVDDARAWRFQLVTELRAAGFDVDANRLT